MIIARYSRIHINAELGVSFKWVGLQSIPVWSWSWQGYCLPLLSYWAWLACGSPEVAGRHQYAKYSAALAVAEGMLCYGDVVGLCSEIQRSEKVRLDWQTAVVFPLFKKGRSMPGCWGGKSIH